MWSGRSGNFLPIYPLQQASAFRLQFDQDCHTCILVSPTVLSPSGVPHKVVRNFRKSFSMPTNVSFAEVERTDAVDNEASTALTGGEGGDGMHDRNTLELNSQDSLAQDAHSVGP